MVFTILIPSGVPEIVEAGEKPLVILNNDLPTLSSQAVKIFDQATGQVLFAKNAEEVLPIASITKLFTAYSVLKTLPLTAEYEVTESDVAAYGRAGRLASGQVYSVRELLFPLLLESSNDAAAVYERETNDEVVRNAQELLEGLGVKDTTLVDASGLSPRNLSTASDIALASSLIYVDEPHLFDITRLKSQGGRYVSWANNDPVIGPDFKGGKHGYTDAAGRTIVAFFEEEVEGTSKNIGYVLLGSADLAEDIKKAREFIKESVRLQ